MTDIERLMRNEIKLINCMFQRNGIRAKATADLAINVETGYIRYGLHLAMDEKFARVESLQREFSNLLTNHRQKAGVKGRCEVIPASSPVLALITPHPSPKPLPWSPRKVTTTAAHSMLIGRSYLSGPRDEYIAFDDAPHVLIAGTTGAGKSILLQTMLLSLCAGTPPGDLKLVLVDLKNEDLVPFECLPHVMRFAGTKATALDAIEMVVAEKDRRVENRGYQPYRLVLVIDELAQLAGDKAARMMLGDLASIGRSKAINLIGATQHPTEAGGLGALLKANFPVRLVGMVAPGQSHIATGRPRTHADLLPGKGAFLRCQGPDVVRFQSFFIGGGEVEGMAKFIARDVWGSAGVGGYEGGYRPAESGYVTGYEVVMGGYHTSESGARSITGYDARKNPFPIADGRPLTEHESAQARTMRDRGAFDTAGKFSMNRAVLAIYGSKNQDRLQWVRDALESVASDDKIIRLRKVG